MIYIIYSKCNFIYYPFNARHLNETFIGDYYWQYIIFRNSLKGGNYSVSQKNRTATINIT